MCGIIGYVGSNSAAPIILDGLRRLEYRGYDSAGMAVLQAGSIQIRRDVGKLPALAMRLSQHPVNGTIGIGHTRWATHGRPSERNAHPHTDCGGEIVVVHNGIVENFLELRKKLISQGHAFSSETDTEVLAHLVEEHMRHGHPLVEAVRMMLRDIRGAHGIVVMSTREPDQLVAARLGNAGGIAIGFGQGEMYVASDVPAILEFTRRMTFLEDRQLAVVRADGLECMSITGERFSPILRDVPWDPVAAARGEYRHFMQKEIYEQARSITDTIRGRVDFEAGMIQLPEVHLTDRSIKRIRKIVIAACGTSYYAGLVGKFMIESLARLPVEVDYGSEFRYRDPLIDRTSLIVAITQSGETVDTLAAMEEGQAKGARLLSIVNVFGSQAERMSDDLIMMHAGPEIGVASTKAFTASLTDLYLLALFLGQLRGIISPVEMRAHLDELVQLPEKVGAVLANGNDYEELSREFFDREHFLYLGRGINYPIALEGALKLKEISYIHAEGYPAGEMKHGPIALLDERMPAVAIAVRDSVYDKMISQIEQVKARDGIVIALATIGDETIREKADHVLYIPPASPLLTPILAVIPLQLFAYHMAVRRGADVDQPRNLAKSVTVE